MTIDPPRLTPERRIAVLDAELVQLETSSGVRIFVGGQEAQLLWYATVDSFKEGIWVATILCAQATCERALAAMISLRELPGHAVPAPKGWEKWGLGMIIKHVREQGWVPAAVLSDVEELCEVRKPYGHWRMPFEPGTIGRQVAEELLVAGIDPIGIRERIPLSKHTTRHGPR